MNNFYENFKYIETNPLGVDVFLKTNNPYEYIK